MDQAPQNAEVHAPATSARVDDLARAASQITPALQRFADAWIKKADITHAYLITHPDCKSARHAKTRGRAILQDPRVVAYLAARRAQALDSTGADGEKLGWELELRSVAFAHFNPKKVPVKEKVSALRTLGEAKGWLKQQQVGAGVRATFNFRIGGPGVLGGERVISVEGDSQPSSSVAPTASAAPSSTEIEVDVNLNPETQATEVLPPAVETRHGLPERPKNPETGHHSLFRADNT